MLSTGECCSHELSDGFMLDPNVSDCVSLDAFVIPEFNKDQRAIVENANLFGYV